MIRRSRARPRSSPAGMVLIAVLWIVAALSIAVTGLTRSIKQEAALMGASRVTLQAAAAGEAAIAIVLQRLVAASGSLTTLQEIPVTFDQRVISVHVVPLNGLIDINAAPVELLARLYALAGGAQGLAQATVAARERKDARGASVRFEAPEDLLQIPGFSYALYAKVAGLVSTDTRGSGAVNALAAPIDVLAVLADGDAATARRIAGQRQAGRGAIDMTGLTGNIVQAGSSRRLRLTARVGTPDGAVVDVERDVDLTPNRRDGAPWQLFHSTNRIEPAVSSH